jgi:hypothetical protein
MEILGLAMIVVLVILAIFLYVMFVPRGETPQEAKRGLTDPKLAAATLDAILRTTVYCSSKQQKYSVTELLQDCYYWQIIMCEPTHDSCYAAKNRTTIMLNSTLNKWGRSYQFQTKNSVATTEPDLIIGSCSSTRAQNKPAHQPVPMPSGVLNVTLRICS